MQFECKIGHARLESWWNGIGTYCSCVLKLTNPPQQGEHIETDVQGFVRTIDITSVELLTN